VSFEWWVVLVALPEKVILGGTGTTRGTPSTHHSEDTTFPFLLTLGASTHHEAIRGNAPRFLAEGGSLFSALLSLLLSP